VFAEGLPNGGEADDDDVEYLKRQSSEQTHTNKVSS
jgi:hypothetical protein